MGQKLFDGKNYEKRCEICLNAKLPEDRSVVLCRKHGVVEPGSSCRSFRYDPLKRSPARVKLGGQFDEEDFKL